MIPPKVVLKLKSRIERLGAWRYRKVADVKLEVAETMEHFRKLPRGLTYRKAPVGTKWGKEWGSAWFRGRIRVPAICTGKRVYFRMLTWGEMLLFVKGEPFAGMDHQHREVLLTRESTGGEAFRIHVEAYAGHRIPDVTPGRPGMHYHQSIGCPSHDVPLTLDSSELLVEREQTAALFYDADVLFRTAMSMDENSMRRAMILDRLNEAIDVMPFHPGSDEELEKTSRAARELIAPLLSLKNSPTTPRVGVVGHTHIDVGWLWPVRESIRKAARTFSTFLGLMKDYPELTFLQSQPKLLEMIETHYPKLLPRIQDAVKKGVWEPNGGMWVEADCNVTGGESLIRQFLEGRKMTMKLFGYQSDTLWLPDVFGYSAALPQILKKCEIENFVTSKINWNDTNRFPHDTFIWEGIDGTEIFTHFITSRIGGYNADISPEVSRNCWDTVLRKEVQDGVIGSIGFGDGGGGVTREMCERMRRMNDLEGCVKTSFVTASRFLKRLREQNVKRPRWVGELYLELHRGTYTSQARTKRYNRKLEFLLRDVELFSALAMRFGLEYPAAELERNWRILLTNQFHDIIPGSSIRTVYEVAEAKYAQMEQDLVVLKEKALRKLGSALDTSGAGAPLIVANSLSWAREDVVIVEGGTYLSARDAEGNEMPVQHVTDGGKKRLAIAVRTDALSVAPIFLRKSGEIGTSAFKYTARTLDTPHYKVKFDATGKITCLFDKAAGREVVQAGRRLNDFYTAEDAPITCDAWDIDLFYRDKVARENRLVSRDVVADGPLFITFRSRYKIGRKSTLVQDMTFYARSRRIDFRTEADWQETHVLLKVGFPIDVHADTYRSEIQFGHFVRNMHSNTSHDQAKFEKCGHKWVDVSENGYGVAILNDCKYGHDTLDKMISLTLLKSPVGPDEIADKGHHEFVYAILPHNGDFRVEEVVREAYELNVPIACFRGTKSKGTERKVELCSVSNPNVIVETVKKAEDSDAIIVRVYEAGKSRGAVTIAFGVPVKEVTECNLLERHDAAVAVQNDSITFDIRPFEIKTFKVVPA